MKVQPISDNAAPSTDELTLFLSRYSAWLLGSGATCMRLEKNVSRIAHAFGRRVEVTITPRHIHLSLWKEGEPGAMTTIASAIHKGISFNLNTGLSKLSWEIADRKIDFECARVRFEGLIRNDRQRKWSVLIAASLANASFCRLFGGDLTAMAIVFVATLAGYFLKMLLLGRGVDIRLMAIICAFVSSVLGASGQLFGLGTTPDVALGTSVLYLVPGIPFINSFSDMLYRYYLCAFSRFMDALILTCCLSMGLCAGMLLMNTGMF